MIRQRRSTGEWVMDFATFRAMDFGKLCASLGLRPSKPHKSRGRR